MSSLAAQDASANLVAHRLKLGQAGVRDGVAADEGVGLPCSRKLGYLPVEVSERLAV